MESSRRGRRRETFAHLSRHTVMSRVAVIQMTSTPEVEANLAAARGLLERARAEGAVLAALPENFAIMGLKEADKEPDTRPAPSSVTARANWDCGSWLARFPCASRTTRPASPQHRSSSTIADAV